MMSRDVNPMIGNCSYSKLVYEKAVSRFGEPGSVIELGCGNGGNLARFKTARRRVGIDPFKRNIKAAVRRDRFNLIIGDHRLLKNYRTNEFELGITCSVLDHIENYEKAFNDLLRICTKLMIIEPYKKGKERQAQPGETFRWTTTWYHNYVEYLERNSIEFTMERCPLSSKNSGKKYHIFYIGD